MCLTISFLRLKNLGKDDDDNWLLLDILSLIQESLVLNSQLLKKKLQNRILAKQKCFPSCETWSSIFFFSLFLCWISHRHTEPSDNCRRQRNLASKISRPLKRKRPLVPFSRDTLTPTVGHSRPISLKKDPTNFSLFYRPYQRMPRYDMAVAMTEKIPLEGSFLPAGGPWENDDNSLTVLHVKMEIEASLSRMRYLCSRNRNVHFPIKCAAFFYGNLKTLPQKIGLLGKTIALWGKVKLLLWPYAIQSFCDMTLMSRYLVWLQGKTFKIVLTFQAFLYLVFFLNTHRFKNTVVLLFRHTSVLIHSLALRLL